MFYKWFLISPGAYNFEENLFLEILEFCAVEVEVENCLTSLHSLCTSPLPPPPPQHTQWLDNVKPPRPMGPHW